MPFTRILIDVVMYMFELSVVEYEMNVRIIHLKEHCQRTN